MTKLKLLLEYEKSPVGLGTVKRLNINEEFLVPSVHYPLPTNYSKTKAPSYSIDGRGQAFHRLYKSPRRTKLTNTRDDKRWYT